MVKVKTDIHGVMDLQRTSEVQDHRQHCNNNDYDKRNLGNTIVQDFVKELWSYNFVSANG